jgi:hypothetical protein
MVLNDWYFLIDAKDKNVHKKSKNGQTDNALK